jgi:hypothetical protein
MKRVDWRSALIMLGGLLLGVAWASYNLSVAGPVRSDATLRNLVWAVFAGPLGLFVGWLIARRHELGLAALSCFVLYFFSFFVAQRLEGLLIGAETARATAHMLYFQLMLGLHSLAGIGIILWRSLYTEAVTLRDNTPRV